MRYFLVRFLTEMAMSSAILICVAASGDFSGSPGEQQGDQTARFIAGYQVNGLVIVTKLDSVGREATQLDYANGRHDANVGKCACQLLKIMGAAIFQATQAHHRFKCFFRSLLSMEACNGKVNGGGIQQCNESGLGATWQGAE